VSTDRLHIREIVQKAAAFGSELAARKADIDPAPAWYPYDSIGSLYKLDKLLTDEWAYPLDLTGGDPVLDLCCADGDLSFFLESLGCRVTAVDLPDTNYNRMAGVRAMKGALDSPLEIREMDLDGPFQLEGQYGLVLFLGALYHLKNPFHVLEMLSQHARYAVITTRIARFTPGARLPIRDAPVAYLVDERETNYDSTNYWIFSEAGLRRLLDRTNWVVCRFLTLGDTESSDPASSEGDERAYCLVRSRKVRQQAHLLDGWHQAEPHGWRWTARRFSIAFHEIPRQGPAHLRVNFALPEVLLEQLGPITLAAKMGKQPLGSVRYGTSGEHLYHANVSPPDPASGPLTIEFELDKAIPPGDVDKRELGIIVTSVELD
jgi:tRNA (mo5U34)-methyltransferase